MIGQLMVKEQRYDDADAWFLQAIQRNPNERGWWLARANALRAAGEIDVALTVYQETIARFPDWADAYYEAAWGYRLAGQPERAIQAMNTALSLINKPNVVYSLRAAQIYEWAGRSDEAVALYHKILQMFPNNKVALQGVERLEK